MNVTQLTDSDKNTTLLTHFVTINTCYIYFNIKYFQFPVPLSARTLRIDNQKALSALFGFDHADLIRSPHSTQKTIPFIFLTSSFFKFQITNIVYRMT